MVLMEKTAKNLFGVYATADKAVSADKADSLKRQNILEF